MGQATRRGSARPSARAALAAVAALAPALALALLAPAAPARAADELDRLVLQAPSLSSDRTLSVVATVPDGMTGEPLPAGAFTASQGGTGVPLFAERVLGRPVELVLVLDTRGDAAAVAAEQAAAVDLLRTLPPEVPTTVLPGGRPTTAQQALGDVAALRPSPGLLLDGLPAPAERRRLVVVLAGCDAVRAEARQASGPDVQVSVLATGDCTVAAGRLAGPDPGLVRTGLAPATLLASADEVTRRLSGQYALRTAPGLGDGPVQVTVRSGTAVQTASVPLPAGADSAGGGDGRRTPVVVAAALAALAALGLLADLAVRRRSRLA